ncbi:hypothetical protein BJX99DRAFT_234578 [Aspergillus californicus]
MFQCGLRGTKPTRVKRSRPRAVIPEYLRTSTSVNGSHFSRHSTRAIIPLVLLSWSIFLGCKAFG